MRRFSRLVLLLLLIELVITIAIVTRLRNQAEKPVRYLGLRSPHPRQGLGWAHCAPAHGAGLHSALAVAEPFHVG
jgi:hypothetical protein